MIPSMSLESHPDSHARHERPRRRLLDDPLSIRALAHPLRLDLQALVGRAGTLTAADAARELGISQALASHHLRQLGKYGFVEQVEGDDQRARPWRLTETSHTWRGAEATPEGRAAADVLEQLLAERALNRLVAWQEERPAWEPRWGEHLGIGNSTVYLTAEETAELEESIEALIARYVEARPIDDVSARPDGSVPIDFTLIAVPLSGSADRPVQGG